MQQQHQTSTGVPVETMPATHPEASAIKTTKPGLRELIENRR
jgi:hypothetical protein